LEQLMASTTTASNVSDANLGSLPTDAISYEDLYARWERGNWKATELDFTEDARQWREDFTEFERTAAMWNYCLFFWGEDAVADNLSPYIDAAPLEEQKYFLTTQQVDEARHAVFFKRFMQEVCGVGDGTMAGGLNAIKPQLTVGFRKIFDRLDRMADELRADRSPAQLAAAITLYHVVIEASLAQPGQHFICSYLEERDQLPAFREGMENIAADEQRHIGFGVKILSDLNREDPVRVPKAVGKILREVTRYTQQVLMPPNWDERYVTVFNSTFDEVGVEGLMSMTTKLRSAGMPIDSLPGPPLLPAGRSPKPASSACAKGPRRRTSRRKRSCSTRSAARSARSTASRGRRRSSGSSPIPTCRRGTSPSTTARAPSPKARRRSPTCACSSPTKTGSTSSASASTRCNSSRAGDCGLRAIRLRSKS
jgi:ribonucleotide reductase beta subunit family protein with ferritin-like domain